ncbi:MAG: outer membrane lipoprotein carrier protein LolA [Burkholderiales bacterium RIFCSPLOWO2_12_FULL_64_99]|nr:MAG: outer membrane lipoprotein carrier protein LolA [Burkholderiales bacterium RIFCSPHIGHO2_12_FULL_63_20]OGB64582.1 MAG: outer membrane lipoprotein carrier protein LolA [Burkholderiales bacterium RIFCSPLOWO2_12_FULL_64_99]
MRTPWGRTSALAVGLTMACGVAQADAVASLRAFVKDVQTGRGEFTQTVTSPDGKKTRKSKGSLEFQRPNRFRFAYTTPTEQLIVGDGKQVWLHDVDLNQVTVRPMSESIGATPAALLAGGALDKDFTLRNVTALSSSAATAASMPLQATSWEWVEALPRHKEGQFQSVRVGFRKGQLAALEILDSFGQRSRLDFAQFESKVTLPATRFQFTPPAGADVLRQP